MNQENVLSVSADLIIFFIAKSSNKQNKMYSILPDGAQKNEMCYIIHKSM